MDIIEEISEKFDQQAKAKNLKKKIPIWEMAEYQPYDETCRNFKKSSYAYDLKRIEAAKKSGKLRDIKTDGLEVEKLYDYKELCDIMGETYHKTSNNQRDAQLRVWKCFFDLEQIYVVGRKKYVIHEIYPEARFELYVGQEDEKDFRSEYAKYIYQVLLMCLYRKETINDDSEYLEFKTTRWNLFKILGFANELFFQNYVYPGEYAVTDPRDPECFVDYTKGPLQKQFYKDAFNKFNDTLETALQTLHTCKKINYYWDLKVKDKNQWHTATRNEMFAVTVVEGDCLAQFGCESFIEAALEDKFQECRNNIKKQLSLKHGIDNYYDEIDIWVAKKNVKTGIIRMYERYTGRTIQQELGLTYEQLCQKENAEKLNDLILRYFYELNAPRRARQNADWYLSGQKHVSQMNAAEKKAYYERALKKKQDLIEKYIKLDHYVSILTRGPMSVTAPDQWIEEEDSYGIDDGLFRSKKTQTVE